MDTSVVFAKAQIDDMADALAEASGLAAEFEDAARLGVRRVFCWWPTKVFTSRYYQDGCAWFSHAYTGIHGQLYRTHKQAADSFRIVPEQGEGDRE